MHSILTEEEYNELRQFWREYTWPGPRYDEIGLDREVIVWDFIAWIDADEDYPYYGLEEIRAFLTEKEQREGTTVTNE